MVHFDAMLAQPLNHGSFDRRLVQVDDQAGPAVFLGQASRQFGPAAQRPAAEDERGVGVDDVPFGSDRISGRFGLP